MNEVAVRDKRSKPGTVQESGWWWRTMGFTRTHIIGVFVTEMALGIIGAGFAIVGFLQFSATGTRYLLMAVCIFLVQLSVLLSSILSLLFYMGSRINRGSDNPSASSEALTPISNERDA